MEKCDKNKGKVILLRLRSKEDKKFLEQNADRARMSVNTYLIHILNQAKVFDGVVENGVVHE